MTLKKLNLALLLAFFTTASFAGTTTLSGTAGNFTLTGTDTYGFGEIFVRTANFISDNGLGKIIGIAGGLAALVLANATRYAGAAVTAGIAMFGAFFPQAVDALYGAMI